MKSRLYTTQDNTEIFVIHYRGKPVLTKPRSMYSRPNVTKKIYMTMPAARLGVRYLPVEFDRESVEIVRYVPENHVV